MKISDFFQLFPQGIPCHLLWGLVEAVSLHIVGDGRAPLGAEHFLNNIAAGIEQHIHINGAVLAEDGFFHSGVSERDEIERHAF